MFSVYTPPSSPDSLLWLNPSSPPSSRGDPFDFEGEDPPFARATDPLAASYHTNRMKRGAESSPIRHSPNKKQRLSRHFSDFQETNVSCSTLTDTDSSIWEEALEKAFDTGNRSIDLSGRNMVSIPGRLISDLDKVVVLPETRETSDDSRLRITRPVEKHRTFARFETAPASTGIAWNASLVRNKAASSSQILSGASTDHIDLYLGNNSITKLPNELFALRNLRILSLRNNGITYLPPEVGRLENLVDLNIALNQLPFLPSELDKMKNLTKLIVLPNPFLSESCGGAPRVLPTRQIGSSVPSLTELALRVLLSKKPFTKPRTLLEERYELPIATGPNFCAISKPLQHVLATCVPGSVTIDEAVNVLSKSHESEITGIGVCPSDAHGTKESVFVQHVEERFTWVDCVTGIKIGGYAPLRWRGCERGCLAFLGGGTGEDERTHISEVGVDEVGIVQTVSLAAVLDFDD